MRKTIMLQVIIIVSLVFLVSCKTAQTPIGGAVVTQPTVYYGEGSYAPDIKFVDMKGRLHHLASFYRDANIIAFVGGDCMQTSNPQLMRMSLNLKGDISIIEICSPEVDSDYGKQCRILRGVKEKNLISLCDGDGEARTLYNVTTPTAIFVLNKMGIIKDIGTIEELEELSQKATLIVIEEEKRRQMIYDGF